MAKVSSYIRGNPKESLDTDALESELISVEVHSETPPDDGFAIDDLFFNCESCGSEVSRECISHYSPKCDESRINISSDTLSEKETCNDKSSSKRNDSAYLHLFDDAPNFAREKNTENLHGDIILSNFDGTMPPVLNSKLENSHVNDFMLIEASDFLSCPRIKSRRSSVCDAEVSSCQKNGFTLSSISLLSQGNRVPTNSVDSCFISDKQNGENSFSNSSSDGIVDFLCDNINDLLEVNLSKDTQIAPKQTFSNINADNCGSTSSAGLRSKSVDNVCINDLLSPCINGDCENDFTKNDRPLYFEPSSSIDSSCNSYCSSSDSEFVHWDSVLLPFEKVACSHSFNNDILSSIGQDDLSKTKFRESSFPSEYSSDFQNDSPFKTILGNYDNNNTSDCDLDNLLQQCDQEEIHSETNTLLASLAQNHLTNKSECEEQFDSGIDSVKSYLISENLPNSIDEYVNTPENIETQNFKVAEKNTETVDSSLSDIFKFLNFDGTCNSNTYNDVIKSQSPVEISMLSNEKVKDADVELVSGIDLSFCVKDGTAVRAGSYETPVTQLQQVNSRESYSHIQNPNSLALDCFDSLSSPINHSLVFAKQPKINSGNDSLFAKALSYKPKPKKLMIEKALKIKRELLKKYCHQQNDWKDLYENYTIVNERTVMPSDLGVLSGGRFIFSPTSGIQECN